MSPRRAPPALLALSPGDLDERGAQRLPARLAAAVSAGLRGLLLREPRLADRALLALGRELRALLGPAGWLSLHDRAHLAAAIGADALHLGGRSLRPGEVRPWLPPAIAIGLSSHDGDACGAWEGADYLLHAPVFAVPGKGPALGPEGIARAVARTPVPLWGLGGITPASAPAVLAAGACGVAVLRGILAAPDPAAAVRQYLAALGAAAGP